MEEKKKIDQISLATAVTGSKMWMFICAAEPNRKVNVEMTYDDLKKISDLLIEGEEIMGTKRIFREGDLNKIIKGFGRSKQHIKLIEEMSELTKELCKLLIGTGNKKNMEEEIADVQIMLNQLMLMHGITPADIEYVMNEKIVRTLDVLKKKEKHADRES